MHLREFVFIFEAYISHTTEITQLETRNRQVVSKVNTLATKPNVHKVYTDSQNIRHNINVAIREIVIMNNDT